jgi:hypothetical protein
VAEHGLLPAAARLYASFGWHAAVVRLTAVGASGDLLQAAVARFRFNGNLTGSGDDVDNADPGRRVGEPMHDGA